MPSWNDLLRELRFAEGKHDNIRRKYLAELYELTGRNVILYYSGWLQKKDLQSQIGPIDFSIEETDKNALMAAIHKLDRSKGLDLILHTPGGDLAVSESLVHYLRSMFGTNIRAIIPQIAMSAGTMISLSCNEIVMGLHSSLGPIDPQLNGMSAHGIREEIERAKNELKQDQASAIYWQPIFQKYPPTFIGECEKAIEWMEEMVKEWLITGMFVNWPDAESKAQKVVEELGDHALTKSHGRRISIDTIEKLGINVKRLEDDQDLQEAVLSLHHICMLTLDQTGTYKLIENHTGTAYVRQLSI